MQLVVDLDVIRRKIDSLQATRRRLESIMQSLENTIRILTAASWISMAARAFLHQFRILQRQTQESITRVDGYIRDLDRAFNIYQQAEQRITQVTSGLRTDVFGV
jgi:WXG100 family type VII secretion target